MRLGNGFWFYLKRNRKMETKSYKFAFEKCIKKCHTQLMKINKIQSKNEKKKVGNKTK